ncbi:MAG: DNA-deoxyinosine glycosylase [Chromatiaceae bacterium]|jgi:TDG/mug DNA glycosylase family protein|nr:DNA-deoxyinosine glycosylase [Chromatiaceae bacterium]
MTRIHSFPPIAAGSAQRLILGSIPGKASLLARQYYAHPRNAFWPIIEAVFGISATLAYDERCAYLRARGVAVWDVLKTCTRTSSLDSDIDAASIVPNDFAAFFAGHPGIQMVYFNGAMAEKAFRRHVLPALPDAMGRIPCVRLPSTSPANASFSFERKLQMWRLLEHQPHADGPR